ncbi:MAG: proline--tRNA ligase [Saccharofermentanales bacterium]|jgi:prolyl-tRNA synthetase|nr:proline--tRNA ligase [Bacillota bacterium]NLB08924.1 proline--tRNA ligase [Clostridiales bacterium]
MRLSKGYFFTLREDQHDEESASGNLMVRAGMIKKSSAGIYMMLPLGLLAKRKVERIIREEMNAIDSHELVMPALIPEEVYIDSGRRETFGNSMFSLHDRFQRPFVLGPTHEELFASAARMHIRSYKDLPLSLYQFQSKYRDEPRPRFGLIRVREFTMKDAYTFDRDLEGLDVAYGKMFQAYKNIFDRLHLDYVIVTADTGVMGGLLSEEFQALSPIGEDILVIDDENKYATNIEVTPCILEGTASAEEKRPHSKVSTPGAKTIEQVTALFDLPATMFVKTMIYNVDGELYAVCVRGDRDVNETKLRKLVGGFESALATADEIERVTGAPVGFAGPIGLEIPLLVDQEISLMRNFITGANEADQHLIDVNLDDFPEHRIADLRMIALGDRSIKGGKIRFARGIEVGNTFKLGTKYAEAMDVYYTDQDNVRRPVFMGSYGIGPARCLAAIVEQNHTENAILWPKEIAPVEVAIVVVNINNAEQMQVADELYELLTRQGYDVMLDDRDERAGVKFNDMDLIGAYARITLGRDLKDGKVGFKLLKEEQEIAVPVAEVAARVAEIFGERGNYRRDLYS